MRKTLLSVVIGLSILSTTNTGNAANGTSFNDLKGHWAKDTIEFAIKEGVVDGYEDGTFKPDLSVSRAEFIKLVVSSLKYNTKSNGGAWYTAFVEAAVSNGIHSEKDFTTGDLNSPITREEMARIAVRATGQANYEDKKWMFLATSKGIINGLDDAGTLGPEESTTRAQAVTVLRRIIKIREGASLPSDKYAISAAEIYWHKTNVITMLPQYFGFASRNGIQNFRTDLLRYDGANGYSEVEKYVVVDMDDMNDPNRKLIPSDFRWSTNFGKVYVNHQEDPTNSYALLSFNHINVDLSEPIWFRFAELNIRPFFSRDNVDEAGNLIDVARYSSYKEKDKTYLYGDIDLKSGHNDLSFITGQLLPKGEIGKQGDYFYINRSAAQELGEQIVNEIYISRIDYKLK